MDNIKKKNYKTPTQIQAAMIPLIRDTDCGLKKFFLTFSSWQLYFISCKKNTFILENLNFSNNKYRKNFPWSIKAISIFDRSPQRFIILHCRLIIKLILINYRWYTRTFTNRYWENCCIFIAYNWWNT